MTLLSSVASSLALVASALISPVAETQTAWARAAPVVAGRVLPINDIGSEYDWRRPGLRGVGPLDGPGQGIRSGPNGDGGVTGVHRQVPKDTCRALRSKSARDSQYWRDRYESCRNG